MALKEFYGETCPHCISMKPLVEQVEKEFGVQIEKLEVWNDKENAAELAKLDNGKCGGVPFFINTESGAFICGGTDAESLKKWATGTVS